MPFTQLIPDVSGRGCKLDPCPRCGEVHEGLIVKDLTRPIVEAWPADYDDPVIFHGWTTCPTTGEPILAYDPNRCETLIRMRPSHRKCELLAYKLWELHCLAEKREVHGYDQLHWWIASWLIEEPARFKVAGIWHLFDAVAEVVPVEWKTEVIEMRTKVLDIPMQRMIGHDLVEHIRGDFFKRTLEGADKDFFQGLGVLAKQQLESNPVGEEKNDGAAKRGDDAVAL